MRRYDATQSALAAKDASAGIQRLDGEKEEEDAEEERDGRKLSTEGRGRRRRNTEGRG